MESQIQDKKSPPHERREAFSKLEKRGLLLRQLQFLADRQLAPVDAGIHRLQVSERDALRTGDGGAAGVTFLHDVFAGTGDDGLAATLFAALFTRGRRGGLLRGFLDL